MIADKSAVLHANTGKDDDSLSLQDLEHVAPQETQIHTFSNATIESRMCLSLSLSILKFTGQKQMFF